MGPKEQNMATKKFLKSLQSLFEDDGWTVLPLDPSPAAVLYFKTLTDDFQLTLGIMESSHTRRYTGSFYLSKSFTWSYCSHDFPPEAYSRGGKFLHCDEKIELLEPRYRKAGMIDAWWHDYSEAGIAEFCRAVKLAAPRFVDQPGLAQRVAQSKLVRDHMELTSRVRELVRSDSVDHSPPRLTKMNPNVSGEWYAATAQVLSGHPVRDNPNGIRFVAEDAWFLETLGSS